MGEARTAELRAELPDVPPASLYRQVARLVSLGVDVDALRASVSEEIDAATEEALASPMPDPATAASGVFCEGEPELLGDGMARWSGFTSGGGA